MIYFIVKRVYPISNSKFKNLILKCYDYFNKYYYISEINNYWILNMFNLKQEINKE